MPKSTHICDKCNKEFKTKLKLNSHLKNKYGCSEKLNCDRCGIYFKSAYHLHIHKNKKNKCKNIMLNMSIKALEMDLNDLSIQYFK